MKNNELSLNVAIFFSVLCLVLGIFLGGVAFSTEKTIPVITEKLVIQNCSDVPEFVLTESDYQNNIEEETAEVLFLESIESRDFEKATFDALVDFGETIDSYKDISNIVYEYEVDGNEINVENLKVYYFIDGDDEEKEKALFEDFTVDIDDLDFDELDEAEVDEDYLDNLLVNKVY